MEYKTYDASICLMTKILDLMSGKWKPIILFLIRQEINRFCLLQKSMPRISKKILTEQLRELETDGLVTRIKYGNKAPLVVIYSLTEKGLSLRLLMDEMLNWGVEYLAEGYDASLIAEYMQKPNLIDDQYCKQQTIGNEREC